MDLNLWISIGLAVPLAVLANLLTPKVQNYLDSQIKERSLRRVHQRLKELEYELELATIYRQDRASFHEYLFSVIIKTTFLGAIGGIAAIITVAVPEIVVQLVIFMLSALIVSLCSVAMRRIDQVRFYGNFKDNADKEIARLRANINNSPGGIVQPADESPKASV